MQDVSLIPDDAPARVKTTVLATWIGVSNMTLTRWADKGIIPQPIKLSRQTWLWDVAGVRVALAAHLKAA